MSRLQSERIFHDGQAKERRRDLDPRRLVFADDSYLEHESWIRPAMAHLGEVRGRSVLDFGCGHGMASVVLARRGAVVTGMDLSFEYLKEASERARANQVRLNLVQADGAHLPFAAGSFDRIWGNAVLHHLELDQACREVSRVLRPGGVAVFCEPWGGNPLLEWARRRLPYPGKRRTPDEKPLRPQDLTTLFRHLPGLQVEGHQLLSMLGRVTGPGRLAKGLLKLDERMLESIPSLRRWCRYLVLNLAKHA